MIFFNNLFFILENVKVDPKSVVQILLPNYTKKVVRKV